MAKLCSSVFYRTALVLRSVASISSSHHPTHQLIGLTLRRFVTLFGHHAGHQNSILGEGKDTRDNNTLFRSPLTFQQRWKKKKNVKKSHPKIAVTTQQFLIRPKITRGWRLQDYASTSETPFAIASNVKSLIKQRLKYWRLKKDFNVRNRHRLYRKLGYVPSVSRFRDDDAIVTPLTQIQHLAQLPKSPEHVRFPFRHSFHYEVYWGPSQTYKEPNQSKCFVTFKLSDLTLNSIEERRLLDVIGNDRYDHRTDLICLESNHFDNRNHNASYLGDILQRLLREIKEKDS